MRRLREARMRAGMTQNDVARAVGVSRSTIATWESDTLRGEPGISELTRLADLFGMSVDRFLGGDGDEQAVAFPIIGEVAAGYGVDAVERRTGETVEIPRSWLSMPVDEYFVLRASGDSMYPQILDGDLLLVRRTSAVDSGRIAIVLCGDGSGTVKQIKFSPGGGYIDLVPRNPEYKPRRISGADAESVRIQGEVKKIIRDL